MKTTLQGQSGRIWGSPVGAPQLGKLLQDVAAKAVSAVRDVSERLDQLLRDQAVAAIGSFEEAFKDQAAIAEARFPGLVDDSDFDFALNQLGPCRLLAARSNLRAEDEREYVNLARFLNIAAQGLAYDIGEAEEAEEASDALLRALDGFHDFLQAHSLTGPGYLREQAPPKLIYRTNLAINKPRWRVRSDGVQVSEFAAFLARRSGGHDAARPFTQNEAKHRVAVS
jgi:hypothetical protein